MTTNTNQLTIARLDEAPLHPLYHVYPGQTAPQGAYVELDCEAACLSADWDPQIGGAVPFDVWHGHQRRFPVSADLAAGEINRLMDAITPRAARVVAGYESVWDGSNHVARYAEDAAEADDAIAETCREAEAASGGVWDAANWLGSCSADEYGIAASTTAERLVEIAAAIDAAAVAEGPTVPGTLDQLQSWREDLA